MSFFRINSRHTLLRITPTFRAFLLGFLCVMAPSGYAESDPNEAADIRLLIDISGSMKKNDPANLRIPSVSLLTELIPDGDKAGVWTFGQWVNNLVKHKVVDDAWRNDAKEQAQKINSVALYTNIGAVLEKSSDDFSKPDSDYSNTHFILLTDGMVDIDKDSSKNDQERERILSSVLARFKDKGAKIHAISLSKNADLSLMDKLAIQTGGQSAVAESSEDLTKVFVQALDQAVPSEQVPIEGNEFAIDSSIEEFTALIFRGDGSVPTEIVSPDNSVYTYDQKDEDVKWFQDRGYDLITITRPLEGTWMIKADIQPESRVTVVSNLQLNVSKLPANFFAGEQLHVDVSFIEEDQQVTSPEFLSLLDIDLQLKTEEGKSASKSMSDSKNPPKDGVFKESITKLTKVGQYEVNVLVDGKTFKRSKRQVVNLRAPFDFEFSVKADAPQPYYELVVTPLNDSINLDDTSVFVKTKFPDGTSLISALEKDNDAVRWVLKISPDKGEGVYKVAVKVKSKTLQGKEFQFKPKPFDAEFPIPVGSSNKIVSVNEELPAEEDAVEETIPEQVAEKDAAPIETTPIETAPVIEEESAPDADTAEDPNVAQEGESQEQDYFWVIVGGGITAGLLLITGLIIFLIKRRSKKTEEDAGEILSDDDVESLEDAPSKSEDNEEIPVDEPVLDEPLLEEPMLEEPMLEEPMLEEPMLEEPMLEEPALEETPVEDLSAEKPATDDLDLMETEELETTVDLEDAGSVEDSIEEESTEEESIESLDLSEEPSPEPVQESEELAVEDDVPPVVDTPAEDPAEALDEEIEKALDINDDDDDDEEFNLEDFDIGDTDDLPDTEEKP